MYTSDTRPLTVLNKREEMAKAAMQGILSGTPLQDLACPRMWESIANDAVSAADALIVALEKQPAP